MNKSSNKYRDSITSLFLTRPRLQLCQAQRLDKEKEWTSNVLKVAKAGHKSEGHDWHDG